jgi:hypothetical protein
VSKRPAPVDPKRFQGIPRVRLTSLADSSVLHHGEDACFLAAGYGLVADEWQAEIVNAWLAMRPRVRKFVHPRNGVAVPRQNGKNGALEIRELYGLVELNEAILHTSHQIKTSKKAFERLKHFFGESRDDPDAKFPELNALVAEIRHTNGQERIVLKDLWRVDGRLVRSVGRPLEGAVVEHVAPGGFIEFATRTRKGARGTTYDLLVVDECQHLADEDLEAIRPVISSARGGNPQVIYLGTPPDPDKLDAKIGEAWVRIRSGAVDPKTGQLRSNVKAGFSWIEYGAPDGPMPDLDDLELLYHANPALGVIHGGGQFGLDFETVEGEKADLTPAGYARERLGWWGNPEATANRGVIDMDVWKGLKIPGEKIPTRGTIVVDCHPDLEWTTVAVATDGPTSDRPLGLVDRQEGTRWAIKRVIQLVADLDILEVPEASGATDKKGRPKMTPGVALTPSAHHLSAGLTKAGIAHHKLTSSELGAGCVSLQQMIADAEVAHVGQPALDIAARHSVTRYVGDVQQWDRRANRKTDISPLIAFSVAIQRWRSATVVTPTVVAPPRRSSSTNTTQARATRRTASSTTATPRRPAGGSGGFDPRSSGF